MLSGRDHAHVDILLMGSLNLLLLLLKQFNLLLDSKLFHCDRKEALAYILIDDPC